MVSTISDHFYHEHMSHLELNPLEDMVNLSVEGADGHELMYSGYIEAHLEVPCLDYQEDVLLLVVPHTSYHDSVPILLGTNIIKRCVQHWKEDLDEKMRQRFIPTAWETAKRTLVAQEKHLNRKEDGFVVKSASRETIALQSNHTMTVKGKVKSAFIGRHTVMVHPCKKTILPEGVELCPAVINAKDVGDEISVVLSNMSQQTVVIPPSAILCQLNAVDLEEMPEQIVEETDSLVGVDLTDTQKDLTTEEFQNFKAKIEEWDSLFSKSDIDLGHTDLERHRIRLTDTEPFKQRFRRIPPGMFSELQQHLKQMLDSNVIRKSHSPWASNIVPVRKKDGKLRFCVDYRQLNQRTIKDAYAIPRMEDTLDLLHGKKWFSTLDLKAGYWQVEMEECDKPYTAFTVGPLGLFEFNRLPFGLSNSPATFQRLMERVLGDLNMSICLAYLDDILIFSESYEDHLKHIEMVIQRIKEAGLKLNPSKCKFFRRSVKYLGHVVSSEGLQVDASKTDALEKWPIPENVDDVRMFLGFTGYYRKFVKDYAKIAKPLSDLLVGNGGPSNRRKQKRVSSTGNGTKNTIRLSRP